MFKLPKKQENTGPDTELLPTVQSPFEKYFLPVVVIVATLLVTGLVLVVFLYLRSTKPIANTEVPVATEEIIPLSPFAPKEKALDPTQELEPLDNTVTLTTDISVNLDAGWQTLTTEDSATHSMVSFIVTNESSDSTSEEVIQGEIEAYTPEHVFEDVMETLAKSKEEFSTQTLGGYNVLIRKVYLLTGSAVVGEWKENNKVLLIRVFATSMDEATAIFERIAQTVKFL